MVCHCWRVRGDEVGGRRFFFAFSNALQTFGSCSVLLFMILHSISQFTGTFRSGGVSGVYFRGVGEVSFCTIKKYEFEFVVLSQGLRRGSQKSLYCSENGWLWRGASAHHTHKIRVYLYSPASS